MKLLTLLIALVAFTSQGQQAPKPFDTITEWYGPVVIRTNKAGRIVQGHVAKIPKPNEAFWTLYKTNKLNLRAEGYSVSLRTNGWHAVRYGGAR